MSRILTIDVGAGTMDVLYFDTRCAEHFKAVVKSPVASLSQQIEATPGRLLILGREMGGGAVSRALKERARSGEVSISLSASPTVHHDLDRVRSTGIRVLEDEAAEAMAAEGGYSVLELGDLPIGRLREIASGFDVPFRFDVLGVCAQDHGVPSHGHSHLDHRHQHFRTVLEETPFPHAFLHRAEDLPPDMSRLCSIAEAARSIPADQVYIMDSGMAAILGASLDPRVQRRRNALVLDIATSHTVAAALRGAELIGFFEYHTSDITLERLETLLVDLANGGLSHAQILAEGGHGAYTRGGFGFENTEIILATGPRRALIGPSRLPIELGAPLGDNMMTGAVGVLEAIRRKQGLPEFPLQ